MDEFTWSATVQTAERSVNGQLIVQVGQRIGGRPITLTAIDRQSAWIARSTLEQLAAWGDIPGLQLTLSIRGIPRTVVFRANEGKAIEAQPVMHFSDVDPTDWYTATLNFMEVEA
ncbi:hypothetical protein [Hydrogenophaga defluvii]|uniref:Phage tail protein n=1 Tax=Hydrogenophaga defluvii TaxID=249410 RepID=A0ABW2S9B7_9BURK